MIAQITGQVIEVGETTVVLQVGTVAYEIFVPSGVVQHYKNPAEKNGTPAEQSATFYTIQYIEGATGHGNQFFRLVGFRRRIEKDFFQLYTGVEGIGYKTALKSLIFPIQKIALAIETGDTATLKKLPHIGARTAEKMVATLKGRMQKFTLDQEGRPLTSAVDSDFNAEALQVLRQVGYADAEAAVLIEKALQRNPKIQSTEDMIQEIFRLQSGSQKSA
jgi:Holliday junction DNA helicase RuvA